MRAIPYCPVHHATFLRSFGLCFRSRHFGGIANQADGYGVDQCLANGDKCGSHAARFYCQSRDFAQATSYQRVDPDEITGIIPRASDSCKHIGCNEYVAITCQR